MRHIITSIAASLMEWTVILMIMDVETFKTNVIIFTGNVIMCLTDNFQYQSQSVDIDNITTRKKCLNYIFQQLLRKMRRKISWTDGRTDRRKTVYPPPPSVSRGIITNHYQLYRKHQLNISYNRVILIMKRKFKQWWSSIPPISTKWTIIAHHDSTHRT